MILLAASAAFVGFLHSLAPGHWLPVVLLAKVRNWSMRTAIFGALVAASGHVLVSAGIGFVSAFLGWTFLPEYEEDIERYAALILIFFGIVYAVVSYWRHVSCCGHSHHGPEPKKDKAPFFFLFSLGFSPCIAVAPVIATSATQGHWSALLTTLGFSAGVISALILAVALGKIGLMKLDHPVLEHHGNVLTGLGIALMGLALFFFPI